MPARASGVELLGPLQGSGFQDDSFLVRSAGGQTIRLTPLLYEVLEEVDGTKDLTAIAAAVSERNGRQLHAEDVRYLLDKKLRPLSVLRAPDGAEPEEREANPLLALRLRIVLSNPRLTRALTAPFTVLFRPAVVVAVLAAFVLSTKWLFLDQGLAAAARHVLYEPELLLLVFALTMVSAGFHEFGHAAACQYGGARPGSMGAGLYLVWPVFYTDVTDSYRLSRGGRLRVDLGGLYFNAAFSVAVFALWFVTRWEALLVLIPLQIIQMSHQLLPLVRLDGYHILADIVGVPDLFGRIGPTFRRLLPGRPRPADRIRGLKPWVGVVVVLWVLAVVPILAISLLMLVMAMPRLAATAWDSVGLQANALVAAWAEADLARVGVRALSIVAIAIPLLSSIYLVTRITRRVAQRTWQRTEGRPGLRAVACLVAVALLAFLSWAWWPRDNYRPIEADDRGNLFDAPSAELPSSQAAVATHPAAGLRAIGTTVDLAAAATSAATGPTAGPVDEADGELPWDLRVLEQWGVRVDWNLPDAPGPGDNQVLLINTQDGSALYDLAYSVQWVTEGAVENTNAAYALANCRACTTVAVAFQVVFILHQADVVVPQNFAVAVNAACLRCVTYALATQLVLSLSGPPTDEAMDQLATIWERLAELDEHFGEIPLSEVQAELADIEADIVAVLGDRVIPMPNEQVEPAPDAGAGPGNLEATVPPADTPEESPTTEPPPSTTTETTTPDTTTSTTVPEDTTTTAAP